MGIFNRDGGIMDVIRCDESDYLIWKWHPPKTNPLYSKKANSIRWGSSLRVRDGSVAVFVYPKADGSYQDYIEGPFDQIIDTKNFPVLSGLVGTLYNGATPFQAEVYFINIANLIQVKFLIPYFDVFDPRFMDFGVPTSVSGSISFRIADYREFIKLHRLDSFDLQTFQNQIRDLTIRQVKSVVTNIPEEKGIPIVQLERQILQINASVESCLRSSLEKDFGVVVTRVDISEIILDKESKGYKKLASLTQNRATLFVQAAANIVDSMNARKIGAKQIIKNKKDNTEKKVEEEPKKEKVGILGKIRRGDNTPPPIPIVEYFIAIDGKQEGPIELEAIRKYVIQKTITAETLVWKKGMKEWKKAESIDELKDMFLENELSCPPEIPADNEL